MRKTERLLAALEQAPGTVDELADCARIAAPSCRAMLSELCRMGVVKRIGTIKREVTTVRGVTLFALGDRGRGIPSNGEKP